MPSSTLVLADDLDVELTISSWNTREDRMRELLNNPSILMALGDGGAHVDMLCDAGYPTYLLGTWVREKQAITLEEGVRKLTSDPADLFGLKDRGRLAKGAPADVAIFDPAAIGSTNHGERRYDLPGGAKRIVMPSRGRRIHGRQRRGHLGAGPAHRCQGRQGAAGIGSAPDLCFGRWRTGRDSNPRWLLHHARFPSVCLKPLGHLSGKRGRPLL